MRLDPYTDALTHIKNCDFVAKSICNVTHISKLLIKTLEILAKEKYIVGFDVKSKAEKKEAVVKLNGMLTNLKAIKPRYSIEYRDFEKFEKRYLPSRSVGILIVSTPKGLMTHIEAKKEKIGGRLIAFVF
ncbi:MAG: 30S ribosomal protein S8 [Candidatus Diapherotrites archaeon CG08_land_8_20_14_0_20_30_16]|nr:MAG: 30S ribosomal protein S8 [Candidatus Diapherotrites archaeon CG08_land_8_20_14_0_20_30_16]